jgi:glutamate dehydrogenase (NAD(P)+)
MIPRQMDQFLHERLPENSWRNRLEAQGPLRYVEFRSTDLERLHRLGIGVDRLGPRLVVCMWDEESEIEAGGYLVVDNLAMGRPAMGGFACCPTSPPSPSSTWPAA